MMLELHRLGFFYIIWHLVATGFIVIAGEPPKIRSDYRSVIRANVMERVQMTCPVHQQSRDPGLFFNWNKDNESISMTWIRFETKGSHLIIDEVETEDAGSYVCIATNGFGSQRAVIQLIVLDPLTESTTLDATGEFESPNDLLIEGLSFTEETLRQPRQVRITAGSSLDIHCSVSGYPYPDLIWLKDGAVYKRSQQQQQSQPGETGWTASRFTLEIRRAVSGSSGNYTCLALGLKGKIETTFTIRVLHGSELPDMSEVHPTNVTETRGGKAKFHCWVQSASQPEVEWLKRFPDGFRQDMNLLYANTSLVIGQDHYQKLESDELVRKEDGRSYLKTLQLDPLSEKDAGLYLCLGTNRYGYTAEKTYLNVKPNYETSKDSKSVPLSTMVALPSVLILCVAGGFVCWLRERAKQRRRAELMASATTGWSSHAFAVAQEQQQQQQQQQQQAMEGNVLEAGRSGIGHGSCHSRQALTSGAGCHHLNEEADGGKRTADGLGVDPQTNYYLERHRHHQLEQQRNTSTSLMI